MTTTASSKWVGLAVLLVAVAADVTELTDPNPFDVFMNKVEDVYTWNNTGESYKTDLGNVAYFLNVSSLQWLDTSKAAVEGGNKWTHQVAVIVPQGDKLKIRNVSVAYMTGGCNSNPSIPSKTDEDILVADTIAANIGGVAIVIFQIPNCPYIYPSDPEQRHRSEDAMIAWAWNEYLHDPDKNPEWFPRFPMAKAGMQCMRAAQEFLLKEKYAEIDGWFVGGASKRGWTTWMVGAATCPSCVNIVGIAPLVPIVPDLQAEIHRQWMSYGGFTFAFSDYTAVNFTVHLDDPDFLKGLAHVDPINYLPRLSRIPKVVVLSSDDEFAQMDWTDIWWDKLLGEKHLLIPPSSEHSLATGIPEVLETMGNVAHSIAVGKPTESRPQFTYTTPDATTGKISVTIPKDQTSQPLSVLLRHASTLQDKRRDFRWVRQANNHTEACKLPDIPLKKPFLGGNCLQPINWFKIDLKETSAGSGIYEGTPPKPLIKTHWVGYYIEMKFPSDTGLKTEYKLTTPAWVWPNTLPFKDCTGASCVGNLV